MYDVFGECLNVCVKRLDRDEMTSSPEEMARYYKRLDITLATLKMFRFIEDVTLDSECNENGDHEIKITCEKGYYDEVTVNGELYFSEERPSINIDTEYCLVCIDGSIMLTNDRIECAEKHLAQRKYLLKKLISN